MNGELIRRATPVDIPFLVEAIVSAEKSGTDRCGLATLFGQSEAQVRTHIAAMLNEEVDGCELSVSSFLVSVVDGEPAAAVAGWVEGRQDDLPSGLLKSNLIGATFPPDALEHLRRHADVLAGIRVERDKDTLQLDYVFTADRFRGMGRSARLIEAHLRWARTIMPPLSKAQVQAFSDNVRAIRVYERLGFTVVRKFAALHPRVTDFLPSAEKVLLERAL